MPSQRIWLVGIGFVVVTLLVVGVSWLRVVPSRTSRASAPSPLEHGLIEAGHAPPGALVDYVWIDRAAGIARIPIDRAIDAVVAQPTLIGQRGAQPEETP